MRPNYFLPTDETKTETQQLKALLKDAKGPVAAMVLETLEALSDDMGLALYPIAPELNAAEVAGILGTSIEYVKRHKDDMQGFALGEKEGVMLLRFPRDAVFEFDRVSREKQRAAIQRLSELGEDLGLE